MDKNWTLDIIDVQEEALADEQYMQLYEEYAQAEAQLRQLLQELPSQQRAILEQYILTSVPLYHRLMILAMEHGKKAGDS